MTLSESVPVSELDKTPAVALDSSDSSLRAKCGFCHRGFIDPSEDPLEGGKLYSVQTSSGTIYVHYFCMLFCSKAHQVGTDSEGLFGFYGSEVVKQLQEKSKKICKYCHKPGASATCCRKHCSDSTHFTCGVRVGATFQFFGNMWVHCRKHRQRQLAVKFPTPSDRDCVICYEDVSPDLPEHQTIRVPCCGRFFHRPCIQRYAVISGKEHFKCSNCNDKSRIIKELERMGIYLPVKDADWEDNLYSGFYNYQDMYQQKKTCDVVSCLLADREVSEVDTVREIVLCEACGINGSHLQCSSLSLEDSSFLCADCGGDVEMLYRSANTSNTSSLDTSINDSSLDITDNSLDTTTSSLDISDSCLDATDSSLDITGSDSASLSRDGRDLDTSDSLPDVDEFLRKFEIPSRVSSPSENSVQTSSNGDVEEEREKASAGKGNFFKLAEDFENFLDEVKRKKPASNTFMDVSKPTEAVTEVKTSSHSVVRFLADNHQRATEISPKPSYLTIRKDLFSSDDSSQSNLSDNIYSEAETNEQSPATPDLKEETEMEIDEEPVFIISDKKRKFAALLLSKPKTVKKNINYLTEFYQMLAPEDFTASTKEEERPEQPNEDSVLTLDESVEIEKSASESPTTGLKILDTFTLEEEVTPLKTIQTRLSPKVSKKKSSSPVSCASPKLSEEPNKVISPLMKNSVSSEPVKVVSIKVVSPVVKSSISSEPTRVVSPAVKSSEPVKVSSPTVQSEKPYKPGPRSRTKPHVAPVRQPSPPQTPTPPAPEETQPSAPEETQPSAPDEIRPQVSLENQPPVPAESQPSVPIKTQSPVPKEIQPSVAVETQSPVKYRPGPKSRKKFLVVKEDESEKVPEVVSPKRKTEDLSKSISPNKKLKVDTEVAGEAKGQADESIEDIEKFLAETDTIMEVSPAPPNQAALDRRRAKRPFQCPVCHGFFRAAEVLKQHMAKIHFWQRLLQLPKETPSLQGPFWVCSEVPCHYIHRSKEAIAGHIATNHQVVFKIAKTLFPAFELPQSIITIDDEVMVETVQSSNNNNNNLSQLKTNQAVLVTIP